jgi:hypothetical protein
MKTLRNAASGFLVAGAVAFLAFAFYASLQAEDAPPPAAPEDTPVPPTATATPINTPTNTPTPVPTSTAEPTATSIPTATPTPFVGDVARLRIPRFDVDSAIETVGVNASNQMEVPKDPHATGWYDPRKTGWGGNEFFPGWHGNALFAAHVTYYPSIKGPFYRLAELNEGDEVHVVMANGEEYVYEVFFKERYLVADMPMGELIWNHDRPDDEEWITLITCGGEFRAFSPGGPGEYLHRDVVIARRIP